MKATHQPFIHGNHIVFETMSIDTGPKARHKCWQPTGVEPHRPQCTSTTTNAVRCIVATHLHLLEGPNMKKLNLITGTVYAPSLLSNEAPGSFYRETIVIAPFHIAISSFHLRCFLHVRSLRQGPCWLEKVIGSHWLSLRKGERLKHDVGYIWC